MKLLITNSKDKGDYLIDTLNKFWYSKWASIATPFFTENAFLDTLIKNKCNIRLIVRLCVVTSPSALEKILHCDNVTIKFYIDQHFHSKIYILNKSLIIVGSSNFTNGGLKNNRRINIGIDKEDECFDGLDSLFEEYWGTAKLLTPEKLEKFRNIIVNHQNDAFKIDNSIAKALKDSLYEESQNEDGTDGGEENKDEMSHRPPLSEEHKRKISEGNIGRKHTPLSEEGKMAQAEAMRNELSKPVVCLNTGIKYSSMKEASKTIYNSTRGYGYISDVCREIKTHYKKKIWRFEEDYRMMTKEEIDRLLSELTKIFEGTTIIKEKRKMSFRAISALISQYKRMGCSFFKIISNSGEEYVYFADYFQKSLNKKLIEDEPVGKSVEDIKDYYESVFNIKIGDAMIVDIIASKKSVFYEFEGEYYKSKQYICNSSNHLSYDDVVTRKDALRLINDKNIKFLGGITVEDIYSSQKKYYYQKNKTIFRYEYDYVNEHIK
ncbi:MULTISPECIES: phospholipase D-like domain-containing protein [Clostridium]|uniref:Phospholipase D-like domain-containing protein n=1 Tax=Clostridium frigoriphilum TaxID=443253 RepID=A0ABU7UU58_9CLOT|nr:phospholipase D-like domain-containing protein [Clostridium sp. DSM 17811]MBU3101904.1 hypothetical protein [Clostridium sp. DSM 17811]